MPPHPEMMLLGRKPGLLAYLRSIWARREFATAIAVGEVRSQNMDTVLGNVWHILNPLLLAGIYYLLFGVILGGGSDAVDPDGEQTRTIRAGINNYAAFVVIGVFVFHYSQKSVLSGAKSIVSNEGLIRSIRFPRAVLPISTVLGHAIAFLPAVAVMLVIAVITGERPSVAWLLLLPLFALQTLFNVGAAFVVARVTDSFHDVQNVLPFIFRLLFYMSGVLYSVERFVEDPTILALFDFNPFYAFITLIRGPLMGELPLLEPRLLAIGAGWTFVLLVGGLLYFRAGEDRYGRG